MSAIPDIGDTFQHGQDREGWDNGYRVKGWLRRADSGRPAGPDRCPLVFCARDEAEYVCGIGVGGVIVRVSEVTVDGRVPWTAEALEAARQEAAALIGQMIR